MNRIILAVIFLAAALTTLVLAQEPDKESPLHDPAKTEKDAPSAEPAAPFDRGDEKAEKELKKAYSRVASAESKGLERVVSEAGVTMDPSALGFKKFTCDGKLYWQSGHDPVLKLEDPKALGGMKVAAYCEQAFGPYCLFIFGLPGWDSWFAGANFKYIDAPKDTPKELLEDKFIHVTFQDEYRGTQTYELRDNKVVAVTLDLEIMDEPISATVVFTYEDLGKELRIKEIELNGAMNMTMPDEDPPEDAKDAKPGDPPAAPEKHKTDIHQVVKLTEHATVGKAEICTKMESQISLNFGGAKKLEIPAYLELKNPKANKDVSDDDLKPMRDAEKLKAAARKKAEDDKKAEAPPKDGPAPKDSKDK